MFSALTIYQLCVFIFHFISNGWAFFSVFFSMTWWYIACNCVYRLNIKATTECVPRINLGISGTSAINPNICSQYIRINVPRNIWHSHSAWNSNNKLITKTESKKKIVRRKNIPKKNNCFVVQNSMNYLLPFQWLYCTLIRFRLVFLVSGLSACCCCCCCLSRVIELEDIAFVNHCLCCGSEPQYT